MNILINDDVYQKIMFWVKKSSVECSGLGKVRIEGSTLRVVSACLLEQENAAASTDIDAKAVARAMYELKDEEGLLNFWWHSHVHMKAFWSGTDEQTIKDIGQHGFCLATVFNKSEESRTAYFQGSKAHMPEVYLDELEFEVDRVLDASQVTAWGAEFEAKCKTKAWTPTTTYPSYYGGNEWNSDDYWADRYSPHAPLHPVLDIGTRRLTTITQLEQNIKVETLEKIDSYADSMLLENTEKAVKDWLIKICATCNQIERFFIEKVELADGLKKEYKHIYIDMANSHIESLRGKEAIAQ